MSSRVRERSSCLELLRLQLQLTYLLGQRAGRQVGLSLREGQNEERYVLKKVMVSKGTPVKLGMVDAGWSVVVCCFLFDKMPKDVAVAGWMTGSHLSR